MSGTVAICPIAFYSYVNNSPDDRSAQAVAYHWAFRTMAVSLEMVLPGLAGYALDNWANTKVLFTLIGFGLGIPLAIWHLLRMTASLGELRGPRWGKREKEEDDGPEEPGREGFSQ